jgi:crotonobetainyl-CoA:carnitine CoA-transferase CaiB-like acyl-CoA transferase
MVGSLKGLKVLDITQSVAGPFATQILGDLCADVIKIERPSTGDDTRKWGPPFWGEDSATFQALNRNKRSIELDLKKSGGREILKSLIKEADILVQNLRPGSFDKLGFSYTEVSEVNPKIIYCSITAFGHAGPKKDDPGYDPLLQAFSGLMSITGEEGRPPVRIPASILDQGTALWSVIAILDAVRQRDMTGKGAYLQTSLLNTALMWLPAQICGYFADGTIPKPLGSGTTGIAPYQAYPTEDGYLIIAAGNDNLWEKLCFAIDREELIEDPRFVHNPERVENREILFEELEKTLRTKSSEIWIYRLSEAGVPVTPVHTLDQVVHHEQVLAINGFAKLSHPTITDFKLINTPFINNSSYPGIQKLPPLLGEHSKEILEELGYDEEKIKELSSEGCVGSKVLT